MVWIIQWQCLSPSHLLSICFSRAGEWLLGMSYNVIMSALQQSVLV